MYMNFYNLRGGPFGITPDPRFLFLSAAHREALAALVYGVSQRKGFISVIGEVGTGKTIILRAFLEGIDRTQTTAISLLNPLATFDQILDEILPPEFVGTSTDRFRTLQEWLIQEYRQGRNVVVAIDEAQCMAPATMERLRLLSNLETAEHKLIQVVLAGQPELDQKLSQPTLRQLRERIAVKAKIWPLDQANSIAYIMHRLSKVRMSGSEPVFTQLALKYLAVQGKGNPRRLNILCDSALLIGYSYQKRPIPLSVAWEARTGTNRPPNRRQASVVRALAIVGVIAMAVGLAVFGSRWVIDSDVVLQSSAVEISDQHASTPLEVQTVALPGLSASAPDFVERDAIRQSVRPDTDTNLVSKTVIMIAAQEPANVAANRSDIKPRNSFGFETVVVTKGDGLWQMCRDIYGDADSEIVRMVIEANPHIRDSDNLEIGQEIVFPSLADLGTPDTTRMTKAAIED